VGGRRAELAALRVQAWATVGALVISAFACYIAFRGTRDQEATNSAQRAINEQQKRINEQQQKKDLVRNAELVDLQHQSVAEQAVVLQITNRSPVTIRDLVVPSRSKHAALVFRELDPCSGIQVNLSMAFGLVSPDDVASWYGVVLFFRDRYGFWMTGKGEPMPVLESDTKPIIDMTAIASDDRFPLAVSLDDGVPVGACPLRSESVRRFQFLGGCR
jgi:hypothetical protein